jgi:LysM repeat protein
MGSIRPLVTITILVVVGAFLYVKINEGPVKTRTGDNKTLDQAPDGVPPLATTKGTTLAAESTAPAWPSGTAATTPAPFSPAPATAGAPAATKKETDNLPAVPPIPELPELPATTNLASPSTPPAAVPPKDLPAEIPTARYADEQGQKSNTAGVKDAFSLASPSTTTATEPGKSNLPAASAQLSVSSPLTSPMAPPAQSPDATSAPQQSAPSGLGSSPAASSPQASAQNPLRSVSPPNLPPISAPAGPAAEADRYASAFTASSPPSAAPAAPNPTAAPTAATFAASWPAIQAALDRRDLKQAHQLLSRWHGNASLTPTEAERVESLLSQLAGTVIYSNEHQLEPARVVKQGESLETIAREYNVPWQLLAKINGIQSRDQLRPGQQLKVVRGPFSAVVDLRRNDVTLMVDDRYAGKFQVSVPPGTTLAEGQWVVDQILAGPSSTANPSAYATTPVPADRIIILRNLAPNPAAGTPTLVIASSSASTGPAPGPPTLRVSPQDAEELSDILSIGSRVIVRR